MEISLLSHQGLYFQGKDSSFAFNPFDQSGNLDLQSKKVDFIVSNKSCQPVEKLPEEIRLFNWPGEMEKSGVALNAQPQYPNKELNKNTLAYLIIVDKFRICVLGDLNDSIHSEMIESFGDVDLLIFPTTTNDKFLHDLIEDMGPKAILPVNSIENPISNDLFFSKLGLSAPEISSSIKINSKNDLDAEQLKIFLLN